MGYVDRDLRCSAKQRGNVHSSRPAQYRGLRKRSGPLMEPLQSGHKRDFASETALVQYLNGTILFEVRILDPHGAV